MGEAALAGIKVLDLSTMLPGPYCSMMLADFGAEVIKIEQPGKGDQARYYYPFWNNGMGYRHIMVNRNKKSITLNLKSEEGKKIFLKLAKEADVILEQYRPGVMKRLGIDYDTIKELNPRIIFCSVSGFGQSGPNMNVAAHDLNYLGAAGVISLTGRKNGKPYIPGIPVSDITSGYTAAMGILIALHARQHTGKGQYVDACLFNAAMSTIAVDAGIYFGSGNNVQRGESALTGGIPNYYIYETKDGRYLTLAALEQKFWTNFCNAIERGDLINEAGINEDLSVDQSPAKVKQRERLFMTLTELFLTKTLREWEAFFDGKDVCIGAVKTLDEVFADDHVKSQEMVLELDDERLGKHKQLGFPFKLSGTPGAFVRSAPELGEHNEEIFGQLGYSKEDILNLKFSNVI